MKIVKQAQRKKVQVKQKINWIVKVAQRKIIQVNYSTKGRTKLTSHFRSVCVCVI